MSWKLECNRCEREMDTDDSDFIIDHTDADCSEFVCRKCREIAMTDAASKPTIPALMPPASEDNANRRRRLPPRRCSPAIEFEHGGVVYRAQYTIDETGLAELFLNCGKEGSTADTFGREAAVILSIALQHGTPLDVIRDALPRLADGSPAGPIGIVIAQIEREEKL